MTRKKSHKSKFPKVNGIQMKIRASRGIWITDFVTIAIPENETETAVPIELGIGVTNNTSSPFSFLIYGGLIPELITPDNQVLKPQKPTNRPFGNQRHHWSLIRPGTSIGFHLKAKFFWQNNSLHLSIPTNPDYDWEPPVTPENSWTFDALQLGTYQLRFTYKKSSREVLSFIPEISQLAELEGIATQQLATSFVNLQLVKPVGAGKSAVEIDGIYFETLVPKPVLSVPKKETGAKTPVHLAGIRITNNTPNPVCFSFYVTVIPQILGKDGQILYRGYFSDWSRQAEESDFILVMPGEYISFSPEVALWWQENDQFELVISAEDGGCYTFQITELGTYKIQLNYENTTSSMKVYNYEVSNWKQIENIWTGMVITPFVEFRLT